MDATLYGHNNLLYAWYNWGVFVAFVLALGAVFWVFFDSQRRGKESILWKVVAVVSLILILPSVILRIDPSLGTRVQRAIDILGYLGLAAGVAATVTLFAYSLGLGVKTNRCPNCGQPQDPSWDHCPYCSPPVSTIASPPPPVIGASPSPLDLRQEPWLEPTRAPISPGLGAEPVRGMSGLGVESMPPIGPQKTEILIKEPPQLAWLIVKSGARTGREFRLGEVSNVGRDASQNDIVVDEPSVGRQHARIRLENGQFVLYDLATTNGTFVNGQQVQKQTLADGDAVRMGSAEFTFMEVKPPKT